LHHEHPKSVFPSLIIAVAPPESRLKNDSGEYLDWLNYRAIPEGLDVLEYVALVLLILVVLVLFYGIIVIHDIPYEIAVHRNHPHQDVLHVAGWVSLFTLHAIWPFLWIWAMMYHEDRGWGIDTSSGGGSPDGTLAERLEAIEARLEALEPPAGD
jgi:hypothetical protein